MGVSKLKVCNDRIMAMIVVRKREKADKDKTVD